MDTASFLRHILPESGLFCVAEQYPSGGFNHHFFDSIDEMAAAVIRLDSTRTVFHACSSYKATDGGRTQRNVARVKAFFLDLDVGENKDYETQREAAAAIKAATTALNFPIPTMVKSGRGLHVYWTFEASIDGDVWKNAAGMLRQALDHMKVKHDPSRTTDQASILRPVGAHWKKQQPYKPVELLIQGASKPFGYYMEQLSAYARNNELAPPQPSRAAMAMFQVEQLGVKKEYPPSSAITVASLCAQLAHMRNMKGAVSEPEWRNSIGVIKHCVEGDELAHEWSQGDPRYDYQQTQDKIDRWETGPTSCEQFEKTNSHICTGCKFKGKVTSPIQLGYVAKVEVPVEVIQPAGLLKDVVDISEFWPDGFRWNTEANRLEHLVEDKDGVPRWQWFCTSLFYPTTRVQFQDGTWGQKIFMKVSEGKYREFDLPTKTLAATDTLCSSLAAYEVVIRNTSLARNSALMYVSQFREMLQQKERELKIEKRFGWVFGSGGHDEFIIGNHLIKRDGEGRVSLDPDIKYDRHIYEGELTRGTEAEWTRIINEVYNRPGVEVYQFTLMALLSSPLVEIIGQDGWHGIPVALTGEGGQGKTSVGIAAASAYGPAHMFKFDAANATNNAPDPFFGLMYNLPVILDEYTGKDPKVVMNQLYSMSTGQGRLRMNQKGGLSDIIFYWNLIPLVTGNMNINETVQVMHGQVASAGQVRVFEYVFKNDEAVKPFEGTNVKALLDSQLPQNYGLVGRHAIRYMMNHVPEIRRKFYELRDKYSKPEYSTDSKERFFIDLIVTAQIGGQIFKQLGFIHFDVDAVVRWALNHMSSLRKTREEFRLTSDDVASRFLASLHGSILCTETYGNAKFSEMASDLYPIRNGVQARLCTKERRFLVSFTAFREWCRSVGLFPNTILDELIADGYVKKPDGTLNRIYLGKGSSYTTPQQRVIEFNYDMLSPVQLSDTESRIGTVTSISDARKQTV